MFYNPKYEELSDAFRDIAENVLKHFGGKPDYIIGLQRGGLIPAVHISHLLNTPLKVADYSHTDSVGDNKHSHIDYIPELPYTVRKVLLVDDILDTGSAVNGFLNALQLHDDCEVVIATLYNKRGNIVDNCKYTIFAWRTIQPGDPFVNFPWEGEYETL